jgi:hypothetical protein
MLVLNFLLIHKFLIKKVLTKSDFGYNILIELALEG